MRVIAFGVVAAALSVALSGPASAADVAKPKKDKSQEIVCKTDSYVGSHIPDRICKTRAEWDEATKQSQQYLDDSRKMGVEPPKPTGG